MYTTADLWVSLCSQKFGNAAILIPDAQTAVNDAIFDYVVSNKALSAMMSYGYWHGATYFIGVTEYDPWNYQAPTPISYNPATP